MKGKKYGNNIFLRSRFFSWLLPLYVMYLNFIIPEYKIHLLNKNKKIIEKFENIKNNLENKSKNIRKNEIFPSEKSKKKKETLGRVLWVRKKRRKLD